MTCQNAYRAKLKTPQEAVLCVNSGDWVDYGAAHNFPTLLDRALAKRKGELKDVKVRTMLAQQAVQAVESDPAQESFRLYSGMYDKVERGYADKGLCEFMPVTYGNLSRLYRTHIHVDVAMVSVSPMDRHGYFSFSLTNCAAKVLTECAGKVIVEVDEHLPRVMGGADHCIHIDEVDCVIEGDHACLPVAAPVKPSKEDLSIAKHIVEQIPDGAVLQLGIGGTPAAVGRLLANSDRKDLGMHTGLLVDAYLDMYRNGRLTNRKKSVDKGRGVWTMCIGSQELYDWTKENRGLSSCPVSYTHAAATIAKIDRFISVNDCIEVDLFGQVNAESSGTRQISGTGGQLDFLMGAFLSEGGKGFICVKSTYSTKNGEAVSRIVPRLPEGSIVSDPRSQSNYLVSEYGIVNLAGLSIRERAEKIISLAHPDFRDGLERNAAEMGIWR